MITTLGGQYYESGGLSWPKVKVWVLKECRVHALACAQAHQGDVVDSGW